jgi:pyruvate dehydrogenase E2 component (dihydrolipoamide acetyltransferase)
MRQAIAAAMARSKREVPHYYLGCELDVEDAVRWLEALNRVRPIAERVLFAAFALKAIALDLCWRKAERSRSRGQAFNAVPAVFCLPSPEGRHSSH